MRIFKNWILLFTNFNKFFKLSILLIFKEFINTKMNEKNAEECEELFLYRLTVKNNLNCVFINIEIALRIYLSMMVTNCSGERSFLSLKLIKNWLRTTITQIKLENLTRLHIIEQDIIKTFDFENKISDLSKIKSRKVSY